MKQHSQSKKLPELPKKANRREAAVDGKVAEKLRKLHGHPNWALEVKIKGNKLAPHQRTALKQVENGKFLHKLPDMGQKNPFDYVHLGDADAIVCTVDGRDVHCVVNDGVFDFDFRI